MAWKTLDDMDFAGKRALVRVDINVPVENGVVTDTSRIDRIAATVDDIQAKGGKVILMAHFGRPKGQIVPEMSLEIIAPTVSDVLGLPVTFVNGDYANAVAEMDAGDVLLLENLRFNPGEEKNDASFAQRLASLADIYVNDAFSAAHRAHASTEAIAKLLPSCAGRLMAEELGALEKALGAPARPVVAVVGGAKVSTKLDLLGNLVGKVDHLVIGGGMANTFLAAQGINVGKSLCEHDLADTARKILAKAETAGCEIILPRDIVIAREFKANADNETVAAADCPDDAMIFDAGPQTVTYINEVVKSAKTLIMNGPLGVFELTPFHKGTFGILDVIAAQTNAGALISVGGGGDTVAAINASDHADDFTYISTAGGAFLEWMEGKTLPGVAALGV
ncbi:phosphoglycerate kinase [Loktanella sp. D2R18]|uniref:phosphoglycerate kinase n=1 Tax=Rhodobacterales TaxID=204455 RepID=UPI000DE885AC|nr:MULTISPECIES: phosphoglycerate kinase [Rhodobacterales]MDO6589700.1 phosphoglycerate kinase [Yoonia sp. 1_MG-2023]RBW44325.1 phosphoglycerate kinase [Loktanella sp. D2R18]